MIFEYFNLLRTRQWVKQLVIFIPVLALNQGLTLKMFSELLLFAVFFSLVASIIYIVNDFSDVNEDKLDSRYSDRPFVKKTISLKAGFYTAIVLTGISGLTLAYLKLNQAVMFLMAVYIVTNLAYSGFRLKRHELIGNSLVALGFPIRFECGALLLGLEFSFWAFILLFEFAFFLLSGKRYQKMNGDVELNAMSASYLNLKNVYCLLTTILSASFFFVTFIAFILDPKTTQLWGHEFLILSVIPVTLILFRLVKLILNLDSQKYITDRFYYDRLVFFLGAITLLFFYLGKVFSL